MLAELALWLTAPVGLASRRAGHLGRAVALWSRATRRRRDWAPHLVASRAFIETAILGLPNRRKVLVLGSGLLQDVPMQALLDAFDEVILVDAAHLLPARLRHVNSRKVRFVERDLSGVDGAGPRRRPLSDYAADDAVDLVISANLLSQLPLPFAERRDAPPDIGRRIVEGHLADLASFRARVCMVTDVAYDEVGPGGVDGGQVDLMEGVILPTPDESWAWDVSPRGEEDALIAYRHIVHAWRDINGAVGQRKRPPDDAGGLAD
jgi:hypothetical protein